MTTLDEQEHTKYIDLYNSHKGLPTTDSVIELAKFVTHIASIKETLLEFGCGRGQATQYLRDNGYNCLGMDITKAPVCELYEKVPDWFIETPIWQLPFKDNQFDLTFSTDIMEHIPPELVEKSIKEIYRVTKIETFHAISDMPNTPYHMSVHYIHWWREAFKSYNDKGIETNLIESRSSETLFYFINRLSK